MARARNASSAHEDLDTMLPEYDFSKGVRGVTAKRYAEGTNVVVLDPDVSKVFPTAVSVNEALRVLARLANLRVPRSRRNRTA